MNIKWHKETINALGMISAKSTIINKLNAVSAMSDDPKLCEFAELIIREIERTSNNTKNTRAVDMKIGAPTASKAYSYCESAISAE